jgi:hypothetical protein
MAAVGDLNSETSDTTIINTGSTGLLLGGTLNITTCDIDITSQDSTLQLLQCDVDREGQYTIAAPTYYIKHAFNINAQIDSNIGTSDSQNGEPESLGAGGNGNDDAWKITGTAITDYEFDGPNNIEINLPTGQSTYTVGTITACDDRGETCDFDVTMTVSSSTNGTLSTTFSYDPANSFIGLINDDIENAQFAYWTSLPGGVPPTVNDADRLAAVLADSDLTTHYATAQASFCDAVAGKNLIDTYSLTLDALDYDTTSRLSKLAANRNVNDNNVFVENDQVVLENASVLQYGLTVDTVGDGNDFVWDGSASSVNVYGILVQRQVENA